MRYNLGNDRNSSFKIHKELMNITNNIYSVKNKSNKAISVKINDHKSLVNEESTLYSDSSFIRRNIKINNNFNTINISKKKNKINNRNLYKEAKLNSISIKTITKRNKINSRNMVNKNFCLNKKNININTAKNYFSKNYFVDENLKQQLSFNENFDRYNNIFLNNSNLDSKKSKQKMIFDNSDFNIEQINKKKVTNKFRKSSIKYLKYNNEEIKKNYNKIINKKKSNIALRNHSSRKGRYSNTYDHSKIINKKEEYELNDILTILKAKNINDALKIINKLLTYKNIIHKLKRIYLENNNSKMQSEIKIRDILFWLLYQKNENNKYENFCKEIMRKNNINNYENFKIYIKNLMTNNFQNNNFVKGLKRIFDGFNKLQPNKTIYRNLSQKHFRNNIINNINDDIL